MKLKVLASLCVGGALLLQGCHKDENDDVISANAQEEAAPAPSSAAEKIIYSSPIDHYQVLISFVEPKDEAKAAGVVLLLGSTESYSEFLSSKDDTWKVNISSRPGMNYQLLAEGDLWGAWDRLAVDHPQINRLPLYVVGHSGDAADAAAQIADHFRWRVSGLIIGSAPQQLHLPNLDTLPVVAYGESSDAFIERLKARGNTQISNVSGDLNEGLSAIRRKQMVPQTLPSYSFTDDNYRKAWPWLEVIARRSEEEPVVVSCNIDGGTLTVTGENVLAIAIDRSPESNFPKNVNKVHLGEQLVTLQSTSAGRAIIGEPDSSVRWKRKSDCPSGFRNFYNGDLVTIVYQDDGADRSYLEAAQALAQKLSRLSLTGLPQVASDVPVVALSRYRPASQPHHRLIAIGSHRVIHTLAENTPGYLPLPRREDHDHPHAYGLIYPPEQQPNVSLACLLVADDLDGLKALESFYGSATALSNNADLVVWSMEEDTYTRESSEIFDSYWGESNQTPFTLALPRQSADSWELFLEDMLAKESGTDFMILPALMSLHLSMPTEVSAGRLNRWIPERQFAKVTVKGSDSAEPLNAILAASNRGHMRGLAPYMSTEKGSVKLDPKRVNKVGSAILVDYSALAQLSEEQREQVKIELLPYSLHELIMRRMQQDPREFARSLLRSSNPGKQQGNQ